MLDHLIDENGLDYETEDIRLVKDLITGDRTTYASSFFSCP
jgi:hypothetical protein